MKNRQVVRLALRFVIAASLMTAGLTAQPASAKGLLPCLPYYVDIQPNDYVSRLSASLSDGGWAAFVSAWLDRGGVPHAYMWISMPGGNSMGASGGGVLEEFFVDPALGSGRAAGTFEYGGRTFALDVTLEGTGDPWVRAPGVGWGCGVYYGGGEVGRDATGVGTVSVSGIGAVSDASPIAILAHALGYGNRVYRSTY